ncbi:MAG TPA: hemerythrin domain-containing protein [Planctomycetota bacterium]|nr:hemerythrin domain-containing protein [Planctomycetota bacterium]
MRSLLEMMDVHAELHELFAVHRDYVVGLEFDRALQALERFEAALRSHMAIEEKHILPLYERRVGHVLGGDPQFFYLEHKNILRNIDSAKEELRRLAQDPKAGRRQAHEFIDREGILRHLLEHHDLREKNVLYPKLDEALTPEERAELLKVCGLREKPEGQR